MYWEESTNNVKQTDINWTNYALIIYVEGSQLHNSLYEEKYILINMQRHVSPNSWPSSGWSNS